MTALSLLIGAALFSWLVVALLRSGLAQRYMLDRPNERSSHTQPTPRGGGLGIVLVVALGLPLTLALSRVAEPLPWLIVLAGGLLIAAISAVDDVRPLPNRLRFGMHMVGAIAALAAFGPLRLVALPGIGEVTLGLLGWPLAFLWIVGLTNAYNFMDGIDGLAGTQALVAGLGWALLGTLAGLPVVAVLGLLIAGGAVGFLGHNWPPARIFMGDVGSAFLGYLFATLMLAAAGTTPLLLGAGVLLVWPFLFDAGLTFLRRWWAGENVFMAHRSHLYQRLVIRGYPQRAITTLYGVLALLGVGAAWLWLRGSPGAAWAGLLIVGAAAAALAAWGQVAASSSPARP